MRERDREREGERKRERGVRSFLKSFFLTWSEYFYIRMEERSETRTRNKQEQRCEQVPIQRRQCTSTVIEQPPLVSLISILKKKNYNEYHHL